MFRAVDHARIAVRDPDAALQDYTTLLGRPPSRCSIELRATSGEEGLVALAFATDDADACAAALRARGIAVDDPLPGEGSALEGRRRCVELPLEATRGVRLLGIERNGEPPQGRSAARAGEVLGLDHVVITTHDLDAAHALYGEKLGLRLALDRSFGGRGLRILFFRLGGVTVEVVGPIEPPAEAGAADGFGGLAWRVGDADAARARLAAEGFDVSEVREGFKPGTRVCTVRSGTCGVPTLLIA